MKKLALVALIVAVMFTASSCLVIKFPGTIGDFVYNDGNAQTWTINAIPGNGDGKVQNDEFARVYNGMTVPQVQYIIGEPLKVGIYYPLSKVQEYYVRYCGSYYSFQFQNGALTYKGSTFTACV